MRKTILLAVSALFISFGAAMAADNGSPIKISLVPGAAIPNTKLVTGLDLGILATNTPGVEGGQIALFYAKAGSGSIGYQYALVSVSDDFAGIKHGFVNVGGSVTGIMTGFVNVSKQMHGIQLGFVNVTQNISGFQLGFANIITKSKLPFMVILNGSF